MLYFIPAWYKEKEWCEDEQSWRVKRAHSEFDDTVKQIQLFHRSGIAVLRFESKRFVAKRFVRHVPPRIRRSPARWTR